MSFLLNDSYYLQVRMADKRGGGILYIWGYMNNCEILFEPKSVVINDSLLLAEAGPIISSHGVDCCRTFKLHSTLGIFRSGFYERLCNWSCIKVLLNSFV